MIKVEATDGRCLSCGELKDVKAIGVCDGKEGDKSLRWYLTKLCYNCRIELKEKLDESM